MAPKQLQVTIKVAEAREEKLCTDVEHIWMKRMHLVTTKARVDIGLILTVSSR